MWEGELAGWSDSFESQEYELRRMLEWGEITEEEFAAEMDALSAHPYPVIDL